MRQQVGGLAAVVRQYLADGFYPTVRRRPPQFRREIRNFSCAPGRARGRNGNTVSRCCLCLVAQV